MRRAALFAALSLIATPVFAAEPADTAAALRDRALTDTTAWTVLEDLTSTVGPRLVGSPGMARAKDWAVKTFTDLGFVNVKDYCFMMLFRRELSWKGARVCQEARSGIEFVANSLPFF